MQSTTNFKLKKIELTDSPPDITVINPNWDAIDTNLKEALTKAKDWDSFKNSGGLLMGTMKFTNYGTGDDGIGTTKAYFNITAKEGTPDQVGLLVETTGGGNGSFHPWSAYKDKVALGTSTIPFKDAYLSEVGSVKFAIQDRLASQTGAWNPVIYEGTSGGTPPAYTSEGSTWVKIGKMVIANFMVRLTADVPTYWRGAAMLMKWLPFPIDRARPSHQYISYYEGLNLPADCKGLTMYRHASADALWLSRMYNGNSYAGMEWLNHTGPGDSLHIQGTLIYFTP